MIFKVLLPLLIVTVASANQCKTGLSEWFLPYGESSRDSDSLTRSVYNIRAPFNAFGYRYPDSKIKVAFGKDKKFGSLRIFPTNGRQTPGAFELRVSRAAYNLTANSYVGRRSVTRKSDLKKIAKIMDQAYPCIDDVPFAPTAAYISTYQCVQYFDSEDTFQVIIVSDNVRTYVILLFHTLSAFVEKSQFGFINYPFPAKYTLGPERVDTNETLLTGTNGIRPGVWVFDVTDGAPRTPSPCGKTPNECTVTDYGLVSGFDGDQTPISGSQEVLVASRLSKGDPCQFKVTINMKVNGMIKFATVMVGQDNGKFARTYALDKKSGFVVGKGVDMSKAGNVDLPHSWVHEGTNITIADTTSGYLLSSPTCSYQVEYKPEGREPQLKVSVGPSYLLKTGGLCQKFEGDFLDGNFHKGETYFIGDE